VRYHRRERDAGKFSRLIALPSDLDPDRIKAKLEHGLLTIRVPKAESVKPRQITITNHFEQNWEVAAMIGKEAKELMVKEKQEVTAAAE
jgi:hypothetical protein